MMYANLMGEEVGGICGCIQSTSIGEGRGGEGRGGDMAVGRAWAKGQWPHHFCKLSACYNNTEVKVIKI